MEDATYDPTERALGTIKDVKNIVNALGEGDVESANKVLEKNQEGRKVNFGSAGMVTTRLMALRLIDEMDQKELNIPSDERLEEIKEVVDSWEKEK